MYVDNRQYFGHLVVTDGEKVENRARPDLYEIFNNKYVCIITQFINSNQFNIFLFEI